MGFITLELAATVRLANAQRPMASATARALITQVQVALASKDTAGAEKETQTDYRLSLFALGKLLITALGGTPFNVRSTPDRDERDLLQSREVIVLIRPALRGCNLLDRGPRRQHGTKILAIHLVKNRLLREII